MKELQLKQSTSMDSQEDENDLRSSVQRKDYYVASREALHITESAIHNVLTFLAGEGLSQASLNQLSRSLRDGKHIDVLRQSQEYMRYVCQNKLSAATLDIFLQAWNALSSYLAVLYRQAHCNYMQLRRSHKISMLAGALRKKMELGELCCQAQKEALLLERRMKRLTREELCNEKKLEKEDLLKQQHVEFVQSHQEKNQPRDFALAVSTA